MRKLFLFASVTAIATSLAVGLSAQANPPVDDPGETRDVSAEEAVPFVEQQFADFFTDCEAFVDSFKNNLLYCDGSDTACLGS